MTDPDNSLRPQHLEALDRANMIRTRRAALKEAVTAGDLPIADVVWLRLPEPQDNVAAGSLTIGDALCSIDRVGPSSMRRVLNAVENGPVSDAKRLRDLTDRQRGAILSLVARVAPWAHSTTEGATA